MKNYYKPKKGSNIRILPPNGVLDLNNDSIKIVSKSYLEKVYKINKCCPICGMGIKPINRKK